MSFGRESVKPVLALIVGFALSAAGSAQEDPLAKPARQLPLAASQSWLLDADTVDGHSVAVGEYGIAIYSDDGKNWTQGQVPIRSMLTGVHMANASTGWAVGHDAAILRTDDGGANWVLQRYAPEEETPFLDVWFDDLRNGIAIGAYGWFFVTDDGGQNWEQLDFLAEDYVSEEDASAADSDDDTGADEGEGDDEGGFDVHEEVIWDDEGGPLDFHLNRLVPGPDGSLLIAAEAGHLFRSRDKGETWVSLPSPYEGSFFGVQPTQGDGLLLFGLRGHMFRSADGGLEWEEIVTGTTALLTGSADLGGGTFVVAGSAGALLRSRDGGVSFDLIQIPDRLANVTVLNLGDDEITLFGENGVRTYGTEIYAPPAAR